LSVTSRTALYSIRHGECYSNCTVQATVQQARGARDLRDENRRFYDLLWSGARLVEPERFNTWPLVRSLLPESARRLEVAPGLRPRLPLEDTQFVDISAPALAKLRGRSAHVVLGEVTSLPFADDAFDLVCALDIIEHVDDDDGALSELSRVAKQGGTLLISTPLHPSRWTPFDDFVGHKRRYEPQCLVAKLRQHDLAVASSAVFGMQPRSSLLVNIGMWWLTHHRERAMWWYNRALMPLGLWFQKELDLTPGMIATDEVDEILLVCLKSRSGLLAGPKRASEAAPAKQIAG
jgi:SAM-dependent methyltransferase